MEVTVLKSKIHRVKVTEANINYIGSITIDEDLLDAANLVEHEQVHVLNYTNGERVITYTIKGKRGSGIICMNGPAALKFSVGDIVLVLAYGTLEIGKAKNFKPAIIFPDTETNRLKK